jgi:hypothetical protein
MDAAGHIQKVNIGYLIYINFIFIIKNFKNLKTCFTKKLFSFISMCQIDIEWFPFDNQTCEMKFGRSYIKIILYKNQNKKTNRLMDIRWQRSGSHAQGRTETGQTARGGCGYERVE